MFLIEFIRKKKKFFYHCGTNHKRLTVAQFMEASRKVFFFVYIYIYIYIYMLVQ